MPSPSRVVPFAFSWRGERLDHRAMGRSWSRVHHPCRHAHVPPRPHHPLLQAVTAVGKIAEHTFPRPPAHMRHPIARKGRTRQTWSGTSGPRHNISHPRHLLSRAAEHDRSDRHCHGGRTFLAGCSTVAVNQASGNLGTYLLVSCQYCDVPAKGRKERRGWDSNPRDDLTPPTRFPIALLRPTRTPLRRRRTGV